MTTDPRKSRAFSTRVAIESGMSRTELRRAEYQRLYHGVRSRGLDENVLADRALAYAQRMPARGAFSHLTAAQLWGMPFGLAVKRASDLHVAVPDGRSPRARGVVGHESAAGFPFVTIGALRVIDPVVAWAQCATLVPLPDLIAAGDYLLTGDPFRGVPPLSDRTQLEAVVQGLAGTRGHAARTEAMRWIRSPVRSRPETFSRLLFVSAGLPEPEVNFALRGKREELVAELDLGWPRFRVGYDYQGEPHLAPGKYRLDNARSERIADEGWSHTKATAIDLFDEPQELVRRLGARLRERGWTGIIQPPHFAPFAR